jgi:hypothetical protein
VAGRIEPLQLGEPDFDAPLIFGERRGTLANTAKRSSMNGPTAFSMSETRLSGV